MAVTVKTDKNVWKNVIEAASEKSADALAEQMMNDSLKKIPDDGEHTLRDIGKIENTGIGSRTLVWNNAYAGYQWFGMRSDGTHVVKHYTTPGTGSAWVESARMENKKDWDKVAQNGFSGGMK